MRSGPAKNRHLQTDTHAHTRTTSIYIANQYQHYIITLANHHAGKRFSIHSYDTCTAVGIYIYFKVQAKENTSTNPDQDINIPSARSKRNNPHTCTFTYRDRRILQLVPTSNNNLSQQSNADRGTRFLPITSWVGNREKSTLLSSVTDKMRGRPKNSVLSSSSSSSITRGAHNISGNYCLIQDSAIRVGCNLQCGGHLIQGRSNGNGKSFLPTSCS